MEKELLPHQQRVVEEKKELDEKITKLVAFQDKDTYKNLFIADREDLADQLNAMNLYSSVLGKRIAKF